MTESFWMALYIGVFFAPLGGLSAVIITYAEYRQHISKRAALAEACRMGLLATILLAATVAGAGWVLGNP